MQERADEQPASTLRSSRAATCRAVMVDERALKQVLLNLLSNAIKFTPRRRRASPSARAAVDARRADAAGHRHRHRHRAEDDLDRVLEPFVQVESKLPRRYEGTGLGLPLSKQLVELHGGRIGIVSKPSFGTTVTVYLPASRLRRGVGRHGRA